MISQYRIYRAACIFAMADKGLTVREIADRQDQIAIGYAEKLEVEETVERAVRMKPAETSTGT